jgi:predicted O-methyltransferase YrrM
MMHSRPSTTGPAVPAQDPLGPLRDYSEMLLAFEDPRNFALDRAHNLFLFGAVVARKPTSVLELGIGSGFTTRALVHALRYNGRGTLTAIDNWADHAGVEPPMAAELRAAGVNIVAPVMEEAFVRSAPDDAYDLLVSDADHRRSGTWIDEHLRIVRHDGFMFFHDTNHENSYKLLGLVEKRVRELGLPFFHFTESTRADERCEWGWLFAINKKHPDAPRRRRTWLGRMIERLTV